MFKFSFLIVLFTLPLLGGGSLWGVPLWAWGSLGATLVYALTLVTVIETRWDALKGDGDG